MKAMLVGILVILCSLSYAMADLAKDLGLQRLHGKVPDLLVEDFQGKTSRLSQYRGHPVVLHFWATWCESCAIELPQLAALSQTWENDGVIFFAVSIDGRNKKQQIERFLRDLHPRLTGWIAQETPETSQYWAWGVPMTYFINGKGESVARSMGARDWTKTPSAKWNGFFKSLN